MKFIDWFAGIGGFRRGMELAGHECVGFCEFDKYAYASYVSMHLLTDEQREELSKLDFTPKECFRLQGWTDDYFEKAQFVNSDSQLYKQAGNGVTVNVIYQIAKKLKETQNEERKRD